MLPISLRHSRVAARRRPSPSRRDSHRDGSGRNSDERERGEKYRRPGQKTKRRQKKYVLMSACLGVVVVVVIVVGAQVFTFVHCARLTLVRFVHPRASLSTPPSVNRGSQLRSIDRRSEQEAGQEETTENEGGETRAATEKPNRRPCRIG